MSNELVRQEEKSLEASYLTETDKRTWWLASRVVGTLACPTNCKTKEDAFARMLYAQSLGLDPLLGIQRIYNVNGVLAVYGDATPAICRAKGDLESIEESFEGKRFEDDFRAICIATRRGEKPKRQEFSVADAKRAGLWDKDIWKKYPARMLQWRARSWALRDACPEALMGVYTVEEAHEIIDVTPTEVRTVDPSERVADAKAAAKARAEAVKAFDAACAGMSSSDQQKWTREHFSGKSLHEMTEPEIYQAAEMLTPPPAETEPEREPSPAVSRDDFHAAQEAAHAARLRVWPKDTRAWIKWCTERLGNGPVDIGYEDLLRIPQMLADEFPEAPKPTNGGKKKPADKPPETPAHLTRAVEILRNAGVADGWDQDECVQNLFGDGRSVGTLTAEEVDILEQRLAGVDTPEEALC